MKKGRSKLYIFSGPNGMPNFSFLFMGVEDAKKNPVDMWLLLGEAKPNSQDVYSSSYTFKNLKIIYVMPWYTDYSPVDTGKLKKIPVKS